MIAAQTSCSLVYHAQNSKYSQWHTIHHTGHNCIGECLTLEGWSVKIQINQIWNYNVWIQPKGSEKDNKLYTVYDTALGQGKTSLSQILEQIIMWKQIFRRGLCWKDCFYFWHAKKRTNKKATFNRSWSKDAMKRTKRNPVQLFPCRLTSF